MSESAAKKKKKEPWEIVIKDRFLQNEKPDNPYATAFLYFIVFFLSFLLIIVCFFQLCQIKGQSMESTLFEGDHILLTRTPSSYKRGDIVVITKKNKSNQDYNIVKRIIAVEGDTILFDKSEIMQGITDDRGNPVYAVSLSIKKSNSDEFVTLDESFINETMRSNAGFGEFNDTDGKYSFGEPIEIPAGHVFVMGDNRNHSEDSRSEDGPYPVSSIYGKSVMKISKGSLLEKFLAFLYHENNAI